MTVQVILRGDGKTKLVKHVKDNTFDVSRGTLSNTEPIVFGLVTKSMHLDTVSIGKFINMPLTVPKTVMPGDHLTFPARALSITLE